MAGIKGKSGRKSLRKEIQFAELVKRSVQICLNALNSPNVPDEEKRKIALEIAKKSLPSEGTLNLNASQPLIVIRNGNQTENTDAVSG